MRVETDLKLGFKDVLIRPKRSTLKSRSLVELDRTFTFLHSKKQWSGVPIIAANMDTIGTFEVAEVLAGHRMLCAIHKHYSLADWQTFIDSQKDDDIFERIMVSTGVADEDFNKLTLRATQRAQDKAQAAENGVPLSRAATPYWVLCVTPAGQGDKRPSAALHSLELDNWSCVRASCIWPLLALLKATFGA